MTLYEDDFSITGKIQMTDIFESFKIVDFDKLVKGKWERQFLCSSYGHICGVRLYVEGSSPIEGNWKHEAVVTIK